MDSKWTHLGLLLAITKPCDIYGRPPSKSNSARATDTKAHVFVQKKTSNERTRRNNAQSNNDELNDLTYVLKEQRQLLLNLDKNITGFNMGVNVGVDAGQSIMHCHIHLIPRRKGDMDNPRGGVRGVIPSNQKYTK